MTKEERAAARAAKRAAQEAEDLAYRAATEKRRAASRRVREAAIRLFGEAVGCGDGGCIFGHLGGQHTNGGCRCIPSHRDDAHACAVVARMLAQVAHEVAREP